MIRFATVIESYDPLILVQSCQLIWFRIGVHGVVIKGPKSKPLWSERNGYWHPVFHLFGWRIGPIHNDQGDL